MNLQFGLAVALVVVAGFLLANKAGAAPMIWAGHGVASKHIVVLGDVPYVLEGALARIGMFQR